MVSHDPFPSVVPLLHFQITKQHEFNQTHIWYILKHFYSLQRRFFYSLQRRLSCKQKLGYVRNGIPLQLVRIWSRKLLFVAKLWLDLRLFKPEGGMQELMNIIRKPWPTTAASSTWHKRRQLVPIRLRFTTDWWHCGWYEIKFFEMEEFSFLHQTMDHTSTYILSFIHKTLMQIRQVSVFHAFDVLSRVIQVWPLLMLNVANFHIVVNVGSMIQNFLSFCGWTALIS